MCNCCREVLSRFMAYLMYSPAPGSRTADFLALVAGMTLVFVHLHSYCDEKRDNLLAHQRLGDRAIVEQALENMEVVSKQDMLAGKCARLLHHLLLIEEDAAQVHTYKADCVRMPDDFHDDHHNALLVKIPYIGRLRIAREGASYAYRSTTASTQAGVCKPNHHWWHRDSSCGKLHFCHKSEGHLSTRLRWS